MTQRAASVDTGTSGAEDDGVPIPPLVIFEPRCKVCRSPHRTEIDEMLRRGDAQTSVRQHWNRVLGKKFFTANNISVHTRKHLYGPDPVDWIQKSLRAQRVLGDANAIPSRTTPEDALQAVVEVGLALIDARVTVPEPGDVVRAATALKRIGRDESDAAVEEVMCALKAFSTAVRNNVPEELWAAIYAEYEAISAPALQKLR